ncbi:hypothetical protein BDZ45DRAFT_686653 [Acephala macrosclerotiorum]|nr:hypothetical protein BDZ45DRAFT_686653 [Acephala macrosclerotiorum]
MSLGIRLLIPIISLSILLFYLTTLTASLALGHGHGHRHRHRHPHQHHRQQQLQESQRSQVQRHIHQAYHRQLASGLAASSPSTSTPTAPLFVSGYRNSSRVIIIPVTETQKTYDFLGAKEGMLFFTKHNNSKAQDAALGNLDYEGKEELEAELNGWKVKREVKMNLTYWLMVWLIPALLLGIHELQ